MELSSYSRLNVDSGDEKLLKKLEKTFEKNLKLSNFWKNLIE
jgi:hypothetical protein